MTLEEIGSSNELMNFMEQKNACVVTFSAHWCGPCKKSKPALEELAKSSPLPVALVHESDIGDYLHTFNIRAFPTYVLFVSKKEIGRIEGANLQGVKKMIEANADKADSIPDTEGHTLGGSHNVEDARSLRLAKLDSAKSSSIGTKADNPDTENKDETNPMETEELKESKPASATSNDTTSDATAGEDKKNPIGDLDKESIKTLTENMGFSLLRAKKALLFSSGTVEAAVEWLMIHQDDDDIDEPISEGDGGTARSYKCNECGKILSNMANLELHANKTGHSDFEESTCVVKPLTPEEKAAKLEEIKKLLAAKRAEREQSEKVDDIQREKQRRFMGQETAKTQEDMEREQRKRDAAARKREKIEQKKERERIKAELEKDKRERMANNGKLKGRLGIDGYAPSAIQYDNGKDFDGEPACQKRPKIGGNASAAKIDEYITKVSSYRAGGDGGKCLKVLKLLVGNAADNPNEDKYKKINMETNAYKNKVKPFLGAKNILLAVGFAIPQDGADRSHLVLKEDADNELLKSTKVKLENALVKYE